MIAYFISLRVSKNGKYDFLYTVAPIHSLIIFEEEIQQNLSSEGKQENHPNVPQASKCFGMHTNNNTPVNQMSQKLTIFKQIQHRRDGK